MITIIFGKSLCSACTEEVEKAKKSGKPYRYFSLDEKDLDADTLAIAAYHGIIAKDGNQDLVLPIVIESDLF